MRMLLQVKFPHKPFNAAVKDGSVGKKIHAIMEQSKPESAYFADCDGMRCGYLIIDVADAAKIPLHAEPWFLTFEADVSLHPVMTAEDLGKADLEAIGKKW